MIEQTKLRRVLRLISLLSDKPSKTVKQLASILETSPKSVYGYLLLLEDIGYCVDKDMQNAYFIFQARETDPSLLIDDELQLLNQLIDTIQTNNPLKESLRKKLYLASSLVPLAEDLIDKHMSRIVQQLSGAMQDNKQVRLLRYQSATGDRPRDRLVEPLSFLKGNSQFVAFDVEQKQVRHFKVKRVENVEILDQSRSFDSTTNPTDLFGFTSDIPLLVKLKLSMRAYRLLIEEFPEAKPYVSVHNIPSEHPHRFVYEARSTIGIGRFILGLPGEIQIEGPEELKNYIKKRVGEYLFTESVNTCADHCKK